MSMEKVSSTDAKNQLNRLLGEVKTGSSFLITNHGEPVAQLIPIAATPRHFGQLPNLVVPEDFDDALPDDELSVGSRQRVNPAGYPHPAVAGQRPLPGRRASPHGTGCPREKLL